MKKCTFFSQEIAIFLFGLEIPVVKKKRSMFHISMMDHVSSVFCQHFCKELIFNYRDQSVAVCSLLVDLFVLRRVYLKGILCILFIYKRYTADK